MKGNPPAANDANRARSRKGAPVQAGEITYRLLVESVRDYGIYIVDPSGIVETWNAGAARINGYAASEVVGRHFSMFYPPTEVAAGKIERALTTAAAVGRFEEEGWRIRKDGTRFWATTIITALRDEQGRLVGFGQVTHDLTERMRAEEERVRLAQAEEANRQKDRFLESEQRARREAEDARRSITTTLRSIADGVITTDATGKVTMLNPVAERLTGWLDAEARGQPLRNVFRIIDEATRDEMVSPVERVLCEGTVVGLANHTMLVSRTGLETAISDSASPIRDESGGIRGVVLVVRDATHERREQANRNFLVEITRILSSSLDYRETLTKVANVTVPHLADWCVVDVIDEEARQLTSVAVANLDPAKVAASEDWSRKYPRDPDAPVGPARVIRTGRSELYPIVDDATLARFANSEEHLEMLKTLGLRSAAVVPITDGIRLLGAMTLLYDASPRRYAEDDLYLLEEVGRRAGVAIENARLYTAEQQARAAADAANRAKDEFLATVSHELRTPLTAILGWARMMTASHFEETKRAHAVETIERNAVVMAQLIEDLLDVSRIISGKMRLEVGSVDLAPVVEAAIESVRPAAEAKCIEIDRRVDGPTGRVLGDAARLQQVVWNLVSNAVKFTPAHGKVVVSLRAADAMIELEVSDNGRGIQPRFLPYVFDAFRQADGTISRSAGGLGLGLAITKHLVELHGGQIEAKSPGDSKGATFLVHLPQMAGTTVPARALPARPTGRTGSPDIQRALEGLRILVVDDDDDTRHMLEVVLEEAGARVRAEGSVADALDALHAELPDVLLSDIAMPGENGFDLIRKLRALPPEQGGDLPAAALTAYARAEDRRKVLAAGYMMHVSKPIDPPELVSAVAALAKFGPSPRATS